MSLSRIFALSAIAPLLVGVVLSLRGFAQEKSIPANSEKRSEATDLKTESTLPPRQLFTGKVVMLQEALTRRGVKSFEEMKDQIVLETDSGELIPIVSDWRGRAFFQDERLRDRKVELIGRRPKGTPYLQVLMVFVFDDKGVRQYFDYWCDICAIPMYEIKLCDCCQAEIRIRMQPRDLPEEFRTPVKK